MNKNLIFIFAIGYLLLSSCSKNIFLNYQTDSLNTGILVLKPSNSTKKTYVTVNDHLFVNKEYVKSVTIYNIPEGDNNFNYTCDNSYYKDKLNEQSSVRINKGQVVTKLIQVPPYSTGFWIYSISPIIIGSLFYILDKK